MVDDTLEISECGNTSIELNAAINSFVETQRLQLSEEKSFLVHIGNNQRYKQTCPKLKVHNVNMKESKSTKYLGNFISSTGGVSDTVWVVAGIEFIIKCVFFISQPCLNSTKYIILYYTQTI